MYLDANGDGLSTSADSLNPTQIETIVDVYLDTSHRRDATQATCDAGPDPLTIFSYVVNLMASGGTVAYSGFTNLQSEMTIGFGEVNTGNGSYKNGWGGTTVLPPGLYRLASLSITVTEGSPFVEIVDQANGSTDFTSFGSQCLGANLDNTYTLGVDWLDVGGLSVTGGGGDQLSLSAPDSLTISEDQPVSITATATGRGQVDVVASNVPAFLQRGEAGSNVSLTGRPGFFDAAAYEIDWTATDDARPGQIVTARTVLVVENTDRPPVVSVPERAVASASAPISFTVQMEDPDGDPIAGLSASGMPPGASLSHGPDGDRFAWVPEPEQTGTFNVDFAASSGVVSGHAATQITAVAPTGPRRPRVDLDILELQPGKRHSERFLSRDDQGNIYADLILVGDVPTSTLEGLGVHVGTRVGSLMTAVSPLDALPALFDMQGLDAVKAPATCELYLDSSLVNVDAAGIRTIGTLQRPLVGRTGAGVLLGFVDSGIDLGHADFRKLTPNGQTRLVGYWVRTHYSFPHAPPQGFNFPTGSSFFGSEWTAQDINNGLVDAWAADSLGHGTAVAGIAAGNGQGFVPCLVGKYQGLAPEADLCVVKAITGSLPEHVLSTRVIDGVEYIFKKADELGKPTVVNLSLGTHKGPHNGRAELDYAINKLIKEYGPGKVVVAAAGNDANTGVHATANLHPGLPQEVALMIEDYVVQPPASAGNQVLIEGWYDNRDSITVAVLTPGNTLVGPVTIVGSAGPVSTPDGMVTICHGSACDPPNWEGGFTTWSPDEYFYIRLQDTYGAISQGTWKIAIGTRSIGGSGVVDLYLPEITMPTLVRFDEVWADPARTITSPASADSVIAVGGYSTRQCWTTTDGQTVCKGYASQLGDILFASSRGPRRGHANEVKPDVIAPGGAIVASRSAASFGPSSGQDSTEIVYGGQYVAQAGTSLAAPHVAGAVALMLGQGYTNPDSIGKNSSVLRIANRLRAAARADAFTGSVPNNTWGAGKLDVRAALAPVLGLRFTSPVRNTVFNSHWGQASVMADSITLTNTFDSVVVWLSVDGCTFSFPVDTLYNLTNRSFTFLFKVPASTVSTDKARLLAIGYKGANRVEVLSDGRFEFALSTVTGDGDVPPVRRLALHGNVPNPFNPLTMIRFETTRAGPVNLRLFAVDGRLVRTLVDQVLPADAYEVQWDGTTDRGNVAASGVYFCELAAEGKRLHSKMILQR
jgi:hypothetical protein